MIRVLKRSRIWDPFKIFDFGPFGVGIDFQDGDFDFAEEDVAVFGSDAKELWKAAELLDGKQAMGSFEGVVILFSETVRAMLGSVFNVRKGNGANGDAKQGYFERISADSIINPGDEPEEKEEAGAGGGENDERNFHNGQIRTGAVPGRLIY